MAARVLIHAPAELTAGKLHRLGEGIGKVVYASPHWVVKRLRTPSEVIALILLWKALRRCEGWLPRRWSRGLLERPSRQIRFLRLLVQATMLIVPRSVWLTRHVKDLWANYRKRDWRGERIAEEQLVGTPFVPAKIEFPPVRVEVGGWPGWMQVSEATERVEMTLHEKLSRLAQAGDSDGLERWLDRFLNQRSRAWQRGIFSLDAHLKNYGVIGERIVLIDPGGLTDRWHEVEQRLSFEEVVLQPHIQLGLGPVLGSRPDMAARFDERWREIVNVESVREHWPSGGGVR